MYDELMTQGGINEIRTAMVIIVKRFVINSRELFSFLADVTEAIIYLLYPGGG